MNKIAIFAGSFDPVTYGHLDIISRACQTFDRLIIGIGTNSSKKYTFSIDERKKFILENVNHPEKIEVQSFSGLLADFAYENNVKVIVKGVRTNQDFDYERMLHEVSITQQAGIDTYILITDQKLSHISSSAVKELCKHHGLIEGYVPLSVKEALEWNINRQKIIGITGTIGVGKSFITQKVLDYYNSKLVPDPDDDPFSPELSALHVDMDAITNELYTREEPVYVSIREKIKNMFNLNTFSKKELGNIVFNDDAALKQLNELVRQPILTLVRKKMNGHKGLVVLNGALLVESNFLSLCNNNIVIVGTSVSERIENLKGRGLNEQQISRRIYSQLSTEEKVTKILNEVEKTKHGKFIPYINSKNNNPKHLEVLFSEIDSIIFSKY